jgi:ABC-type amino acid transport substrate-binding protein
MIACTESGGRSQVRQSSLNAVVQLHNHMGVVTLKFFPSSVPGRVAVLLSVCLFMLAYPACGADLKEIKAKGVLRHLGVRYANFVTGSGDGLDVEMVKLFAQSLGVRYEYVETTWDGVFADLCGKRVKPGGDGFEVIGEAPIRGDIAASGLTILPWRKKLVDFSTPTLPNQVWLVARADSGVKPIVPSGDTEKDLGAVKSQLRGISVIGIYNTCLDPRLYALDKAHANVENFDGSLNELVAAIIDGKAACTLQDVPDALISIDKWPGKIKVIGPVSPMQQMGYAFARTSPELREAFNRFFEQCRKDGTYIGIVRKYYSAIPKYYPEFFSEK